MKILIVGDVHWSTYSSIVRSRGKKYSTRLENLIDSVNWAERMADEENCDRIIYLGDFFDKADLTAEEITALTEIKWSNKHHTLIMGNHESNISTLEYSSAFTLLSKKFEIINKIRMEDMSDDNNGMQFVYIPYTKEENRKDTIKDLTNYLMSNENKTIVFSHNDLKVRYGMYESKQGYDLKDIEDNCDLFINGHIHNGAFVNFKQTIVNIGNLTGQNFSEDASTYAHNIGILDTDKLTLDFIINPYAFNFYKFEINKENDIIDNLNTLETNAVLAIKCKNDLTEELQKALDYHKEKITACRITVYYDETLNSEETTDLKLNNVDHLTQFKNFTLNVFEQEKEKYDLSIVKEELELICA